MTTSAVLHSMENLENLWVHQILHRERDNGLLKWFDLCLTCWTYAHRFNKVYSSEPLNRKCSCARAWVIASLACNWSNRRATLAPRCESLSPTIAPSKLMGTWTAFWLVFHPFNLWFYPRCVLLSLLLLFNQRTPPESSQPPPMEERSQPLLPSPRLTTTVSFGHTLRNRTEQGGRP